MFLCSLLFTVISVIICTEPPEKSRNPTYPESSDVEYSAAKFPITDVWYVKKGDNRKIRAFGMCMSKSGVALTYERKEPGDFFTYGPVRIGYMGDIDTRDVEIKMEYKSNVQMGNMRYMPYMFTSILFGSSYLSAIGQFLTDSMSFGDGKVIKCKTEDYNLINPENDRINYEEFMKTDFKEGAYSGEDKIISNEPTIDPLNYLFCSDTEDYENFVSRFYYPMRYKKLTANGSIVNTARNNLSLAMLKYIADDFASFAGKDQVFADNSFSAAASIGGEFTKPINPVTGATIQPSVNAIFLRSYYKNYWSVEDTKGKMDESILNALTTATTYFYEATQTAYLKQVKFSYETDNEVLAKVEDYTDPDKNPDINLNKEKFIRKIKNSEQSYISKDADGNYTVHGIFAYSNLYYKDWPEYVQSNTIKDNWPKWNNNKNMLLGPKEGQRMSIQFMDMYVATAEKRSEKVTVIDQKRLLESEGWKVSVSDSNEKNELVLCMLDYIFDYDIGIDVWTIVVSSALFIAGFILVCVRQFKVEKKSKSVNVEATNAVGDETNPVDADVNVEVPNDVEEIVVATANNNDDIVVEEDNKVVEKEKVPTAAIEIEPAKNEIHIEEETPVEVRDEI